MSAAEQAESPLDRPVVVTMFPNFSAREKREETVSFHQLALRIHNTSGPEKKKLPWLKLAGFGDIRTGEGSLRNNATANRRRVETGRGRVFIVMARLVRAICRGISA